MSRSLRTTKTNVVETKIPLPGKILKSSQISHSKTVTPNPTLTATSVGSKAATTIPGKIIQQAKEEMTNTVTQSMDPQASTTNSELRALKETLEAKELEIRAKEEELHEMEIDYQNRIEEAAKEHQKQLEDLSRQLEIVNLQRNAYEKVLEDAGINPMTITVDALSNFPSVEGIQKLSSQELGLLSNGIKLKSEQKSSEIEMKYQTLINDIKNKKREYPLKISQMHQLMKQIANQ